MPNTTQILPEATIDARIEALLFATGSAMRLKKLSKILGVTPDEVAEGVSVLKERLGKSGTKLIETEDSVLLATAPAVASTIMDARKNQFKQDIGDAGLEVIAIILYQGSATREKIDYVRGVNSASTIRALSMRGLIEQVSGKIGVSANSYQATTALLAHLGITHVSDLPEYKKTINDLAQFENRTEDNTDTQTENDPDSSHDE